MMNESDPALRTGSSRSGVSVCEGGRGETVRLEQLRDPGTVAESVIVGQADDEAIEGTPEVRQLLGCDDSAAGRYRRLRIESLAGVNHHRDSCLAWVLP